MEETLETAISELVDDTVTKVVETATAALAAVEQEMSNGADKPSPAASATAPSATAVVEQVSEQVSEKVQEVSRELESVTEPEQAKVSEDVQAEAPAVIE